MITVVYIGQSLAIFDFLLLQSDIKIEQVFLPTVEINQIKEWRTRCLLADINLFEDATSQTLLKRLTSQIDLGICAHFDIIAKKVFCIRTPAFVFSRAHHFPQIPPRCCHHPCSLLSLLPCTPVVVLASTSI